MKFLLDTAPLLNFLAAGEVNVLIQYARSRDAQLCVPEIVDLEARGHFAHPLNRFQRTGAEGTWNKVANRHIVILPDSPLGQEGRQVAAELRFIRPPAKNRPGPDARKDLGEDMVMAHAAVLAIQGHQVELLVDERRAVQRFKRYIAEDLERRFPGACARITFTGTPDVVNACDASWLSKAGNRTGLLRELAKFDDGIVAP